MPTMPYHVELTIGRGTDTVTWSIDGGDPADFGPLAGLQITQSSLDNLWPPADAPTECRFELLLPSFAAAPQVRRGAIVVVDVKTATGGTQLGYFNGRIADLKATPDPLGVRMTAVCVDFTADLRDVQVKYPGVDGAWPGQNVDDWNTLYKSLSAATQQLGYQPSPPLTATPTPVGNLAPDQLDGAVMALREKRGAQTAYDYLQDLCRQMALYYPGYPAGGYARAILTPVMGNGPTRSPTAWTVRPRFESPVFVGPFTLANIPDGA